MAQWSLTMGTDEPSRVLLQNCVQKRHMWRQPINFIPENSLCKGFISVDFFGICSYESLHVMASNVKKWRIGPESPLHYSDRLLELVISVMSRA